MAFRGIVIQCWIKLLEALRHVLIFLIWTGKTILSFDVIPIYSAFIIVFYSVEK